MIDQEMEVSGGTKVCVDGLRMKYNDREPIDGRSRDGGERRDESVSRWVENEIESPRVGRWEIKRWR